jgi:hypothetical protein
MIQKIKCFMLDLAGLVLLMAWLKDEIVRLWVR